MGRIREPLSQADCGLPMALEVMGERWSFLILRAAFNGLRHFEDFLTATGIARNILANRLAKLTAHGILERAQMQEDRRKVEYVLTRKGMDLLPALICLRQWGERYGLGVQSNPVLVDRRDCLPVAPIIIQAADGRALIYEDLQWVDAAEVGKAGAECSGPGDLSQ
ncbi:MAG: helix-turn-helix domain-containing protein [Novosphingobium sp.]